jgi:competence protein ComEC
MRAAASIPAVALLAGSAVGLLLPSLPLVLAFAAMALAAVASLWAWRRSRPLALVAGVAAGFFSGGTVLAVDAWQSAWRPPLRVAFERLAHEQRGEAAAGGRSMPEDDNAFAILTGVLRADASARPGGGASLSLDVRSMDAPGAAPIEGGRAPPSAPGLLERRSIGGVSLSVGGSLSVASLDRWRAGRTVRVPALLHRPSRYLDHGVPDEERSLARRGTTLVGSVKSAALVEVVAPGSWPAEAAAAARARVRRAINSAVARWSARSAAIVLAIVIGDRAGLDDEVVRRLQEAGTYHVIAISGGNIAILAGLALAAFRVAGLLGRLAMTAAIAALLAYDYLVGGGASVNRATLMAVAYFAARAVDLRGPPANMLALAAGLMVAAQPLQVLDPGFLLTFGATIAIVFAAPIVSARPLPRALAPIAAMLVASLAAEVALLPVSAFLFSRVTVAGLVLNFAAIPLMGIAQIAGMAVVPASLVSSALAAALGWVAHAGAEGLVRSADLVTVVPALVWRVAPPAWPWIVTYYVAIVTAWSLWRWRAVALGSREGAGLATVRLGTTAVACVAALWIAAEPWAGRSSRGDGRLHVTFLDVGQGDAALVRFPMGATLVVDAGGLPGASPFDLGDRVVAPVLRHAGVRRLGFVAVTHGDIDHAGGVAPIVREFRPASVWEGIPVPPLPVLRTIHAAAIDARASWTNVQAGDLITIDGVQIVVRHPRPPDWERQDVRNDDSMVLELLWRDVSVVLTGDIGRDVEREIAPLFAPSALRVIKVPHHGSLTSSSREFIRALAPRVAVISVGRANTFGHPAADVVARYREVAAEVFRTDQDGAVRVDTDGGSLEVSTFTGQRIFVRTGTRH